jgi:hypothetical protein
VRAGIAVWDLGMFVAWADRQHVLTCIPFFHPPRNFPTASVVGNVTKGKGKRFSRIASLFISELRDFCPEEFDNVE